ncbi:molybdenum cofactor biosynthesis F family protein [Microbacterium arabinogalactanolyticum]|uniref:molybdenum cofactor biosynthesis F family protein n=1 Tax=Microbacterium arabinogalactanolyticum TaxID=69365 RepID=UPI0025574004|nr:molybdenum cofactor biosynthesis F family protein [Microbacterium arabinogalactanolyticum]GLC85152.1 molybdenum cofactor biosynthesis protein F [Microbacterium arabinogalactanolyticum]
MTTMNPSDTSTWLPLEGLAPGFDAYRAPHSTALSGRTVDLVQPDGTRISHRFTDHQVAWEYRPADGTTTTASEDDYDAVVVDEGLLYVQFHPHQHLEKAVSLVIDMRHGRALSALAEIAEPEAGHTRVRQTFTPSEIEGAEVTGEAPHPSAALIGRRVEWVYSPQHAYEHIYLSPHWYSWQCLAGPERGLADTDEASVWEVRPGIYVFAWREKVIPCASVTVADHRDARAIRSHGVLFGLDETGEVPTHFTFGAHGRLLSMTQHTPELEPATFDEA